MPLYENECTACGATGTYFRTIDERKNTPLCEKCGAPTTQIISAVRGFADLPEYVSPVSGKVVRGRRARKYDLESNHCRPYEGFEVEQREAKKVREHKDKQIEKTLDDALGKTIEDLDASNKLGRVSERNDQLPDTTGMRQY